MAHRLTIQNHEDRETISVRADASLIQLALGIVIREQYKIDWLRYTARRTYSLPTRNGTHS